MHQDILQGIAAMRVTFVEVNNQGKVIKWSSYDIENLYVEEGMLMHKDYGPNTRIAEIGLVVREAE